MAESGSRKEQPNISKLRVPTALSFMDKTPTPTKLLKAVDELGLFRDDVENPQSARSTSSNNPFDEAFRLKTSNNEKKNEKPNSSDEMLNTPQIMTFPSLQDIQSAPSSARVIHVSTSTSTPVLTIGTPRPIAPKESHSSGRNEFKPTSSNNSTAQLFIKMPSGDTIKLSQIPFYPHGTDSKVKANQESLAVIEEKRTVARKESSDRKSSKISEVTLKERNRAAAHRSRMKRKKENEINKHKMEQLKSINKHLRTENEQLKNEVLVLREQLKQCSKSSVTIMDASVKSSQTKNQFIPVIPSSTKQ